MAVDVDTGTIWFSKNGTWQNSATISEIGAGTTTNSAFTGKSFATNGIVPSVSAYQSSGNAIVEANFGSPSFSISSGNTDGNGYGNFEYPITCGFYSCEFEKPSGVWIMAYTTIDDPTKILILFFIQEMELLWVAVDKQ